MYLITSVIGALFTIIPTTIHGALLDLAGPFTPTRYSADIGAVPMRNCMNYKFDFVLNNWCTAGWCSVIHVGNDDSGSKQGNQRMPAIWMHPHLPGKFHMPASTIYSGNPQINVGPAAGLSLDTVYSFDITYDQPGYTVVINDEVIYKNANWGNHCVSGQTCHGVLVADEVPIQIGQNGWYYDTDCTISNLLITDCDDLCGDVDCDDGDLCTDEYCDENTGECVYSDVDCTDAFACTIDSCDPETGCVNEEMDCSNGNICDGEEACVEGECITPDDFECPTNFLCNEDAQQCLRDCSLFAIDGYLTDCSVVFDEQVTQLEEVTAALTSLDTFASVLEERINENAANIEDGDALFDLLKDEVADITADVATNTADIATNLDAITTNAADIGTNAGVIATNTGDIATNLESITTNSGSISTNADNIGTNTENIGSNTENIASNLESIASNTAAAESNTGSIGGLDERLADLEDLVAAFAPNTDLGENSENSLGTDTTSGDVTVCQGHYGEGGDEDTLQDTDITWCCYSCNCKDMDDADDSISDDECSAAASSALFNVDLAEFTTKYNGELMVFLVTMNMMLLVALVILGICYCKGDSSKRYAPVQMYATTDDESMQLKQ